MLVSRCCVIICEMPAMPDGNGRVMSFTVIKSRDDLSSNNFFCDAISPSYFASLSELLSFAAGHCLFVSPWVLCFIALKRQPTRIGASHLHR